VAIFLAAVIIAAVAWRYTHPPLRPDEGFSVILTGDGTRLLSDADIQRYDAASHELTLTDECADRLKRMRGPVMGDFVIMVEGEEDLRGVFVPPVVSRSYPSTVVVILYPSLDSDYGVMKIQMGYPWDQPSGYDPRQSSRMIEYFEGTGRLAR